MSEPVKNREEAQELAEEWRAPFTPAYSRYVLGVLMGVNLFNFMDRYLLAVLIEPIKRDLALSDTQLGLLTGIAFALFYGTLGIPIARLADRGVRRSIVAAAVGVWSLMTAMCGFASGFAQLFLFRMGVGVGEAGGLPPSQSLIADVFPPERRSTAMAILQVGANLGVIFGMVLGSFIADAWGWRAAFLSLGAPGLAFAVLIRLTVREPPRQGGGAGIGDQPLAATLRRLFARRTYVHLLVAFSIATFAAYGTGQWSVAFFMRSYGVPLATIAPISGLLQATLGTLSLLAGGVLGDRLVHRDVRWHLWLPSIGLWLIVPIAISIYLAPTWQIGIAISGVAHLVSGIYAGPLAAAVQGIVDARTRALSVAIMMFAVSLIGFGLGPLGIGILSDLLEPRFGDESLRWAMVASTVLYLWAGVHLWFASGSYVADMRLAARGA